MDFTPAKESTPIDKRTEAPAEEEEEEDSSYFGDGIRENVV